jgi:biofilm PGA synthesis lipoprotein PgaB
MELQTVNWRKESEPLPKAEISQTISDLQDMGINHLAYYPDNVFKNVPNADAIREDFIQIPLRMHPYPPTH